jgi:hypothetical protein
VLGAAGAGEMSLSRRYIYDRFLIDLFWGKVKLLMGESPIERFFF